MNFPAAAARSRRAISQVALSALALSATFVALAGTISYEYDEAGRLKKTTYSNGAVTAYSLDASGNRTSLSTVQAPTCAFAARNSEGSDEFTVFARIERTSACNEPVTVSVAVQYVSGTGNYAVGQLSGGATINPGDQYKLQAILPYYGTVPPGSPLRVKVTWTVTSGNGAIFPSESLVTFYNSDCYC